MSAMTFIAQQLRTLVGEQAEDPGLWFDAQTAPEAYLQAALRRLHAAVEEAAGEVPRAALTDANTLIERARRQLLAWHAKYGEYQPQWLPPASDVRWLEDASAYLYAPPPPAATPVQQDAPSGETMAQREEVCAAWHALPDELRKDPRLTRLYHALGGPRMEDPGEADAGGEVPRG